MNEYIRLLYTEWLFIQILWKRAGRHTVLRTGYSPDIRGRSGSASMKVFFLKNCYSVDRELSLFIGAHLILVWNEVKISRLKRDGFAGSFPPNVCGGLLRWLKTNQLLKGVKGEFSALGNKHTRRLRSLSADMHVRASAVIFSLRGFHHVVSCLLGPALAALG